MVSAINPAQPVDGVPAVKSQLRANLAAAKAEIEALQASVAAFPARALAGQRNRIINGNMAINQRAGSTTVPVPNTASATFGPDRWYGQTTTAGGLWGMTTVYGGVSNSPTGFLSYVRLQTTTLRVIAAADSHAFVQCIDANNAYDFRWHTTTGNSIAISFWVRASLTGGYAVSLHNTSLNLSYVSSYTVNTANTWEYKTIVVPAPVLSGSWPTFTSTTYIGLRFDFGSGSNHRTTQNLWISGNYASFTGAVSPISTLSASLDITGVQVEVGTAATMWDYRMFGVELELCERYYQIGQFNQTVYNTAGGGYGHHVSLRTYPRTIPTITRTSESIINITSPAIVPSSTGFILTGSHTATGGADWSANYAASCELTL